MTPDTSKGYILTSLHIPKFMATTVMCSFFHKLLIFLLRSTTFLGLLHYHYLYNAVFSLQ